eukprot:1213095-Prorocentrum_lima.AAC.1
MTSSLVGSEMCIRDRDIGFAAPITAAGVAPAADEDAGDDSGSDSPSDSSEAASDPEADSDTVRLERASWLVDHCASCNRPFLGLIGPLPPGDARLSI